MHLKWHVERHAKRGENLSTLTKFFILCKTFISFYCLKKRKKEVFYASGLFRFIELEGILLKSRFSAPNNLENLQ